MRFVTAFVLGLFASVSQARCQDLKKIWIDKNEVWVQSTAGPRQLTHDGVTKRLATLAPSGSRFVYVVDESSDVRHNEPPKEDVAEMDGTGKLLRHIVPEGYVPGQFERVEWIDGRRVGAMTCGHANCVYWILDGDSGKTLSVMQGGFDFVWSHNHRWVARRFVGFLDAPVGTPQDELDQLMVNETLIYPPRAEIEEDAQTRATHKLIHGHQFGPFTWSPHDAWVAFTDTVTPEGDPYVVLASPTGVILRETVPVDVQFDAKVEWADDTHLQLFTGGRSFQFVVDSMELREITVPEKK